MSEELDELRVKVNPTRKAIEECGAAMSHFLDLGWPKSSLDDLEKLWWRVRDRHGRVRPRINEQEQGTE